MMRKSDFYYDLPQELIAQSPSEKRDHSRLMCLDRVSGKVEHRHFFELTEMLRPGDCLVLNDTRVIPARLIGEKDTGAAIEVLLLRDLGGDTWETLTRPGRKMPVGAEVSFGGGILKGTVTKVVEGGNRHIHFDYDGIFVELLDRLGVMPLPPYITKELGDPERYQTVYSKHSGSAAAPTAGLHFTNELLDELRSKGIKTAFLTLHVGLGTFRPVKEDIITDHKMHTEWYSVSQEAADIINFAKKAGGRIICVGTTACRTVETVAGEDGTMRESSGETDIFIYPGYRFKAMDGLITNFHLPESTLIMLVSAFAGRENVLSAYKTAVDEKYRFFSFGDAMFII